MPQRLMMRLGLEICIMRPVFAFAVEPGGVHAGLQRAEGIQGAVVAYVQDVGDRDADGCRCSFENAGVGFGDAEFVRADGAFEVFDQADALDVCRAVGDGDDGVFGGQVLQGGQGVVVEFDAVAGVGEDFVGDCSQGGVISAIDQAAANGFGAQKVVIVREVGELGNQGFAPAAHGFWGFKQSCCIWRVGFEPVVQGGLSLLDGGPNGPEGVV